jgi:hypothetical protein
MNLKKNLGVVALSLAGLPGCLVAQAIVEHAAISSGVAAVAGSARSAADAIGGALKNLDGTLDTAGKKRHSATAPARSSVARARAPIPSPTKQQSADPAKPAKTYEDPVEIKAGLSYVELLRRFGEPSLQISGDSGEQTLYYSQKDGRGQTEVRVLGGQVLSVDAGGKPSDATVVE